MSRDPEHAARAVAQHFTLANLLRNMSTEDRILLAREIERILRDAAARA